MAQSLMIIEPFPSVCCTGANRRNRHSMKTVPAVLSEEPAFHSHPAANIGSNADHEAQREGELACTNDFYAAVLAMAAHDLRQHLQVIVGFFDLLANELLSDAEQRNIERGRRASRELTNRFDQLMDALRIQQQFGTVREPVQLQPLFDHLSQQLTEPAREKGIDLRFFSTRATLVSSEVMLDGIVRNLVRNALEHTAPGGRVMVGCRRRGTEIRVEVRDNGAGIGQDQLVRVFEPFTRLDTAPPEGLGLGLFIVARAAACLGHRVEVRSAPGRGCCFAVAAPAFVQSR